MTLKSSEAIASLPNQVKPETLSLISPIITKSNSNNLMPPPLPSSAPLKLGILASGSGTNFEAVAAAIANRQLNAEIKVLIYNNPEAKVQQRAHDWQIPAVLLDHRHYGSREALDQDIVECFRQHGVEWTIMAGWMRVVTPVLLDAFPRKVVNIHPSLLPSFKGIRAVEQALKAGVKITGCTVHLVTPEVDSGKIILQAAVPVLADDTVESLHQRIQIQEHLILPAAIALAASIA